MVTKEPAEPERARPGDLELLILEVVFVLVLLVGLSLWSVPAAVVLGGLLGVVACERAMSDRRAAGGEQGGGERP